MAIAISLVGVANAAVWAADNDFSATMNPNGPWTLMKNPSSPFTTCFPDYYQNGSNQQTWADGLWPTQLHVPSWARATVDNFDGLDLRKGSLYAHGAETDRTGTDYTAVRWTAPHAGAATISGRIWNVRNLGRTMIWQLKKNGSVISQGSITGGDGFTYATPQDWANGTGGLAALQQNVVAGDTLELGLISVPSVVGELVGLVFNIATNQPSRLSGTIVPSDYVGALVGKTVTCEVWSGSTLVNKPNITLGAGGAYEFEPTASGSCTLKFRMQSTLIKSVSLVLGASPQVVNVALISGDVDASGEVDAVDIDEVISEFGTTSNVPSDVDGSDEVDAIDIDIVISRFGNIDD